MEALWQKTKDVPLSCGLTVTVRYIGTPEDPFRWETLYADFSTAHERAYAAARKRLTEEHGSMAAAVDAERERLRELGMDEDSVAKYNARALLAAHADSRKDFAAWVKTCIVEACDYDGKTGTDAYVAIYSARGPAGITEAAAAVRAYNSVGPQVGEG